MSKNHRNRSRACGKAETVAANEEKSFELRRLESRKKALAFRITELLHDGAKDEAIIRRAQNKNVVIFSDVSGDVCVNSARIRTRNLILVSGMGQLHLEYGCNRKNNVVFVRFEMRPLCGAEVIGGENATERTVLTFKGPYALDEAMAAFKCLYSFFENEKKKAEAEKNGV